MLRRAHACSQEGSSEHEGGLGQDLVDGYNAQKDRVRKFLTVTKGKGHPALSKKEFSLILRYEKSRIKLMKASPGNFPHHFAGNEGKVNGIIHSPSDTFFREFESTLFNIEGVGQAHAHHINYLGIGFMSAHYGLDQTTTNFLINSWNATQGYLTVSGHQFADIPESRRWAEKGRSLFNEEK